MINWHFYWKNNTTCPKVLLMLSVYFKFSILVIVAVTNSINAEENRFNRIIRLYDNYNYFEERRNIIFDIKNIIDNNLRYIYPLSSDTAFFNSTDINTLLGLKLRRSLETYLKEKRRLFFTALKIEKNDKKYQFNTSTYFLDTTSYLFKLQGRYTYRLSKYLRSNKKKPAVFLQIGTNINSAISHSKKRGYDKDLESIDNDTITILKSDWINKRRQNATLLSHFTGGVGVGKQMNISPVYQIVMLEKRLIKQGVISCRFSEKTAVEIAKLLAENSSYTLTKLEKLKEFKSKLDTIIIKDPSIKKENLRYISPLEIRKILLCNPPVLVSKPKVRLYTTSHVAFEVNRIDNEYPYGEFGIYNDTSYFKSKLQYEHLLGVDFVWGIPFTRYWFLDMKAVRHLLSTDKKIDFYDNDKLKWDEVLDFRWDIQSSLWFTNWILIRLGMKNLPAWIAIPRESPCMSYMHVTLFIEDYLSLKAGVSYCKDKDDHFFYQKWYEPLNRTYNGLVFTITALYNF